MKYRNSIVLAGCVLVVLVGGTYYYYTSQPEAETSVPEVIEENKEIGPNGEVTVTVGTDVYKEGTDSVEGVRLMKYREDSQYGIRYEVQGRDMFQIVSIDGEVLSDYKPDRGHSILCEMVCYPFAKWLSSSEVIIGSYEIKESDGIETTSLNAGATIFNVERRAFRPATDDELASFELYQFVEENN